MAEWELRKDAGNEVYSDGDIEDIILRYVEEGVSLEELFSEELSFPVVYHLSPLRENILNWYSFKKDADILEVGAGCGAITGLLCERAKSVVSVDISPKRSRINYLRHKAYENLRIVVGNVNRIEFDKKFDYIIINGVLEYAALFTEGKTPHKDFLVNLRKYLKTDGKIIIAIENKLGIKYFAGSPEDHTNGYFSGINGYVGTSVKTFGKKELELLVKECGFKRCRFYYPYPDYKFPEEIFTSESIGGYAKREIDYYQDNNYQFFSVQKACESLGTEGVMECFANSFLIEADNGLSQREKQVGYIKLNQDRDEQFRIATELGETATGIKYACKFALSELAKNHVSKMAYRNELRQGKLCGLQGYYDENQGKVFYPYVGSKSVNDEINEIYYNECYSEEDKVVRIILAISHFAESCREGSIYVENYMTKDFVQVFGAAGCKEKCLCMSPANVDLILDNLYYVKDEYVVIDQEWVFDFPIPTDFIIWRAINEFLKRNPHIAMLSGCSAVFETCGLMNEERIENYKLWEEHFVREYVKADRLKRWCYPSMPYDLYNEQKNIWRERTIIDLFYLVGEAFSEDNKIATEVDVINGAFYAIIPLQDIVATKFRLDIAIRACSCRIRRVETDAGEVKIKVNNLSIAGEAREKENAFGWVLFQTDDPQYLLELPDGCSATQLLVEGQLLFE